MSRNICRFLNLKAANIFALRMIGCALFFHTAFHNDNVTVFTKNNTHILCK